MTKSAINRQRGSIIIPVAFSLLVGLILLGGVQLGYYFYMKRDLQNTADLAVLSGVQMLSEQQRDENGVLIDCNDPNGSSHPVQIVTVANIEENFKHGTLSGRVVECGTWSSTLPAPKHFVNTPDASGNYNALRVHLTYDALPFMPFSAGSTIAVEAIAKSNTPVASFQVGSQLLNFNNDALLGLLLQTIGLDIESLTVLDPNGVVNAKITPSGLLDALGLSLGVDDLNAFTPDGIANAKVSLHQLMVKLKAVDKYQALGAELDDLDQTFLKLGIDQIQIPIFDTENNPGLFAFINAGGGMTPQDVALDVELKLSDVLNTAIAIGANGHALKIPHLDLLDLAQARLSIVEPPVIAIGPVGTTGHSAQIRLWLDVNTSNMPLLGFLLNALGTQVHLPVSVDIVSGTGKLEKLQCSKNPPTMDISVVSRILNICIGNMEESSIMSKKSGCEIGLNEHNLIKLLGVPVLSGKLHVPALKDDGLILNLAVGDTDVTNSNPLPLGDTVDDLVNGLLNLLSGLLREPKMSSLPGNWEGDDYDGPDLIPDLAHGYLEATKHQDGVFKGFYNDDAVIKALLIGHDAIGGDGYLPPLLTKDFMTNKKIECLVIFVPLCRETTGTFTDTLKSYTDTGGLSLGLIELLQKFLGPDGYRSCGGILNAVLGDWNSCVEHNLSKLLQENNHRQYIKTIDPNNQEIQSILNSGSNEVTCNGLLCVVLKPVLLALKPILNGVGTVLTAILDNLLGLELGRTEVTALAIDCDPAQLVY